MGLYATTTTLDTLMPEVSFDTATTNIASKCITWAENEVNKKLAKRYTISDFNDTSTSVPPLLTSLTERLSQGYLWQQFSRGSKESLARAKMIIDDVTKNLDMLANNKLDLVDSSGTVIDPTPGLGVLSNTDGYTPTFGEDSELNWVVDPDKLDDIESDRS